MKTCKAFLFVLLFCPLIHVQAQESKKIIVMNQYWAKDGMIEEVYKHRLYASQVRRNLGLKVGRVLLISKTDNESAHVIWECEYASIEDRNKDTQLLMESGQFDEVMEKMGTLTDHFKRTIYEVSTTH
jgi:hypothetical protein